MDGSVQGTARLGIALFRPEEREQTIAPVKSARRRRGEIRQECCALWLHEHRSKLVAIVVAQLERTEHSEANHIRRL
jgi:hypothetical protein